MNFVLFYEVWLKKMNHLNSMPVLWKQYILSHKPEEKRRKQIAVKPFSVFLKVDLLKQARVVFRVVYSFSDAADGPRGRRARGLRRHIVTATRSRVLIARASASRDKSSNISAKGKSAMFWSYF